MRENKSYHYLRKFPVKVLLLFALFVISIYVFGFIVGEVLLEREDKVDSVVSHFITNNMVSDNLTIIMKMITFFGSTNFLLVANTSLFLWYFLFKKNRPRAWDIAVIGISSLLVTHALKELFKRVRPSGSLIAPLYNYSFPSGHASSGFIFYGLLAYLVWKSTIPFRYKYIVSGSLIFFSLLVGFSRIYLRMHYTSDVVAGFCVGFAWLTFSLWLLNKFHA